MFIEISKAKEFSSKFISTISKVSDIASLRIENGKITCIVENGNKTIFLGVYEDSAIEIESTFRVNIGGFKNFAKLIDFASKESDTLNLKCSSNVIEYKSESSNFKYHLMDDTMIRNVVKIEKIISLTGDFKCNLLSSNIKELLKNSSAMADIEKCYFFQKEDKLFCEITDKTLQRVNSISFPVSDSIEGSLNEEYPIRLETLKLLSSSCCKDSFCMSIHTQNKCFIFEVRIDDNTYFKYITSAMLN
jgi:hypothetical protein